jgi:hypothetical protein
VPVPVPIAQIQSHKCSDTVWKVAAVDLLRGVIELVAVATKYVSNSATTVAH